MQSLKRPGRTAPKRLSLVESEPEGVEPGFAEYDDTDELDAYDTFEMYRVICPDCAQSIALLADEQVLPEHALCASPWNPFGLTVCSRHRTSGVTGPLGGRVRHAAGAGDRAPADAPSGARLAYAAVLARRRPGLAPDARTGDAPPRGLIRVARSQEPASQ